MYVVFCYVIASGLLDSAIFGFWSAESARYIIADLTGRRMELSISFAICSLAFIQFLIVHLFSKRAVRSSVIVMCVGGIVASMLWVGIAFSAEASGVVAMRFEYVRKAIETMILILIISADLNWISKDTHRPHASILACR